MAATYYTSVAMDFADDVKHLINVVSGSSQGGELVPAGVSTAQPATLVPLVAAVVLAFFYLQAIEGLGFVVASTLRVGAGATPIRQARKRERFCTAWGEAVYFAVQVFVNYRLFSGLSWYWPSSWDLLMEDGRKAALQTGSTELAHQCTREMRTYYVLEFGWYAMNLVLLFFKKRRSDFLEMLAHHVITSMLIFTSYAFGFFRIGIVVMNLHNLFDPFLNIAKCCHYAFKGPLHILADVSFGVGAVVFLASRLVMYPYAIYHAWFFTAGADPIWDATVDEWACKILLCMLYPIHLFWFYLILKVAQKALIGGTVQNDERSDSESEEDEPANKGAKVCEDKSMKKKK
jgi:hypothetical protein